MASADELYLLDDQVKFLKGWFKDTLASAPIEQLAVVRLDGDLYDSTMDAIKALYPKLSVGGYSIVDDYNAPLFADACGQAIRDYRDEHGISEPMHEIDWTGSYWRRER
jgi:O-methyltransferase